MVTMYYDVHELAEKGDFETLDTLLSKMEASEKDNLLYERDGEEQMIPLQYAIKHEHFDVIELLLDLLRKTYFR